MRYARTPRAGSIWDAVMVLDRKFDEQGRKFDEQSRKFEEQNRKFEEQNRQSESQFKQAVERIDAKYDLWIVERCEMEARIERDRAATEARLAADRKEATERFLLERREARQEFNSQKRWLIANFVTIIVGKVSIFAAIVILMM